MWGAERQCKESGFRGVFMVKLHLKRALVASIKTKILKATLLKYFRMNNWSKYYV